MELSDPPVGHLASAWEPQDLISKWHRVLTGARVAASQLEDTRRTLAKPTTEAVEILESVKEIDPDTTDPEALEWFIQDVNEAVEHLGLFTAEATDWEYTLSELSTSRAPSTDRLEEWSREISDGRNRPDGSA